MDMRVQCLSEESEGQLLAIEWQVGGWANGYVGAVLVREVRQMAAWGGRWDCGRVDGWVVDAVLE